MHNSMQPKLLFLVNMFQSADKLHTHAHAHPCAANMVQFPYNGSNHTLLAMWIERSLGLLQRYTTFPILTYKLDDLATLYQQRMLRDTCKLKGIYAW